MASASAPTSPRTDHLVFIAPLSDFTPPAASRSPSPYEHLGNPCIPAAPDSPRRQAELAAAAQTCWIRTATYLCAFIGVVGGSFLLGMIGRALLDQTKDKTLNTIGNWLPWVFAAVSLPIYRSFSSRISLI